MTYFDFGDPQPDLSPVTIRSKRNMLLRRIGEDTLRHAEVGEVATITRHDAGALCGGDIDFIGDGVLTTGPVS